MQKRTSLLSKTYFILQHTHHASYIIKVKAARCSDICISISVPLHPRSGVSTSNRSTTDRVVSITVDCCYCYCCWPPAPAATAGGAGPASDCDGCDGGGSAGAGAAANSAVAAVAGGATDADCAGRLRASVAAAAAAHGIECANRMAVCCASGGDRQTRRTRRWANRWMRRRRRAAAGRPSRGVLIDRNDGIYV